MSNLPGCSAGISSTACTILIILSMILSTKAMPIQQRKGDNCYNMDCSFEIAWYAIPGSNIYINDLPNYSYSYLVKIWINLYISHANSSLFQYSLYLSQLSL